MFVMNKYISRFFAQKDVFVVSVVFVLLISTMGNLMAEVRQNQEKLIDALNNALNNSSAAYNNGDYDKAIDILDKMPQDIRNKATQSQSDQIDRIIRSSRARQWEQLRTEPLKSQELLDVLFLFIKALESNDFVTAKSFYPEDIHQNMWGCDDNALFVRWNYFVSLFSRPDVKSVMTAMKNYGWNIDVEYVYAVPTIRPYVNPSPFVAVATLTAKDNRNINIQFVELDKKWKIFTPMGHQDDFLKRICGIDILAPSAKIKIRK